MYNNFYDYIEMVFQWGYLSLFAAAWPLTSFLGCVFVWLETRSDAFKLEHVVRRPVSFDCNNIGIWEGIMDVMSFMSIFTNVFLFAFSSQ